MNSFTNTNSRSHSTQIDSEGTYYIKCKGSIATNTEDFEVNIIDKKLPKIDEFQGSLTTDFETIDDPASTDDPILHIENLGMIEFCGSNINLEDKDIDDAIEFSNNGVKLDPTKLPELNMPAAITVEGVHRKITKIKNPAAPRGGVCLEGR